MCVIDIINIWSVLVWSSRLLIQSNFRCNMNNYKWLIQIVGLLVDVIIMYSVLQSDVNVLFSYYAEFKSATKSDNVQYHVCMQVSLYSIDDR